MKHSNLLRQIMVEPNMSIRDVISIIDKGGVQIAFVVNSEGKLLGTVTDGDIRRGLLNGIELSSQIDKVMNKGCRSVLVDADEEEVQRLMLQKQLHQIPVVDEDGILRDIALLADYINPKPLSNSVVIMAGGKGLRMRPLTEFCPKPMLLVSGVPMLEIIIQRCKDVGLKNFYISVNYLKDQIIDYFGDGSKWDVYIEYIHEDAPLGTAGALKLLDGKLNEPFLVMNGDVLTRFDYRRLINSHEANDESLATICIREHSIEVPFGVVRLIDDKVVAIEEKPSVNRFINAGIYVLNPKALDFLEKNHYCDMPDLIDRLIQSGKTVGAFPIHEYWIDVGHSAALSRADGEWS